MIRAATVSSHALDRERVLHEARVIRRAGGPRADWFDDALCPQIGPWLFTVDDDPGATALARAACLLCPVRAECLADALATGERDGVRGGLSMRHLRRSGALGRRPSGRTPKGSPHGTRSRYTGGCRCDECRDANRAYAAAQHRRRVAR